jgi:hypothetical protein
VGVPSSRVLADTWKELQHFQGLFAEAQQSDHYLLARLNERDFQAAVPLLTASRQELDRLLAKSSQTADRSIDTRYDGRVCRACRSGFRLAHRFTP